MFLVYQFGIHALIEVCFLSHIHGVLIYTGMLSDFSAAVSKRVGSAGYTSFVHSATSCTTECLQLECLPHLTQRGAGAALIDMHGARGTVG